LEHAIGCIFQKGSARQGRLGRTNSTKKPIFSVGKSEPLYIAERCIACRSAIIKCWLGLFLGKRTMNQ
ncbi:hypothetical protein, partial [uncultured Fibrobacter sp.]|uniref:hypothetical protein n=1 Tax=uncultured Fibrobacter sp. TaxID=261512 RepID=UPI0028055F60